MAAFPQTGRPARDRRQANVNPLPKYRADLDGMRPVGTQTFAGAAFTANLLFLRAGGGYFEAAESFKPFLHLWSLGVEEQFYLVWPALAVWLCARGRRPGAAIGVLAAASFA